MIVKNTAISDRFYLLKQNVVPSTSVTTILHSDLTESVYSDDVLDIAQNESWYFSLDANNGEKVLASSVTVNSEIWFSSFKPNLNDSGCSLAGGSSQLYRINVKDGLPSYKNTVPGNDTDGGGTDGGGTDGTGTDTNNSTNAKCSAVSCDVFDRFITLENATIPPSPVIIHTPRTSAEDTGSMVCVGMHCQQIEARKMNSTFWREGK